MPQAKLPPNAIHPKTHAAWHMWLQQHHTRSEGVWLVSYKKATGKARFDYDGAVEEALCFGWIDSKPNKLDDERAMLWFAPRKAGTGWSRLNKQRAGKMIKADLMTSAGFAKIEAAKQDGSWNVLDAIEELAIPPDLDRALKVNPIATEYFQAFPRSVKRAILDLVKIYNAVPTEQETLYLAMLDREYTAYCAQAMT